MYYIPLDIETFDGRFYELWVGVYDPPPTHAWDPDGLTMDDWWYDSILIRWSETGPLLRYSYAEMHKLFASLWGYWSFSTDKSTHLFEIHQTRQPLREIAQQAWLLRYEPVSEEGNPDTWVRRGP